MSEPTDKDLPDEQQLDEYLKGGSSVSQQYRQLRNNEVPAQLDRLVLRQAHDAVKNARPAKSRVWMRWTAPLALAASAVLVVSIVIESGVQNDELVMPASAPAPTAPTTMETKRNSEALDDDASASVAGEAQHAPGFVAEAPQAMPEVNTARRVVPPAEVAASAEEAPPPPKVETPPADLRRERNALPPGAVANFQPPVVEAEKAARVLNADAVQGTEEATAGDRGFMRSTQQQATGHRTIAAPQPTSAAVDQMAREKPEQPRQYSDPELWLLDIRILRLQDKQEEADREWRRFREAFPNHPVAQFDAAREVK